MESRNTQRSSGSPSVEQARSLLALSQDLIFWQGEAQRQQEAGEDQRALRLLALQVLGGAPADWAGIMAESVKGLIPRLGADCWYAGILHREAPPALFVTATGPFVPGGDAIRLAPELMAEMAVRLGSGEPFASYRGGGVAGLLWVPVSGDDVAGFSGCHSFSREMRPSETVRELLRGLGEIALAAHLRRCIDHPRQER